MMPFEPSRRSSEAPEVVNEHTFDESPGKFMVPFSFEEPGRLFYHKKPDDRPLEAEVFPSPRTPEFPLSTKTLDPLTPHAGHDPLQLPPISHFDARQHRQRQNRFLGLGATILIALLAFLIGGAIGGGVGGSMVAKEKEKVTRLENTIATTPTVTVTAPGRVETTIVDPAGCPSIHNLTYVPTGSSYSFLRSCEKDIVAPEGIGSVDISSSLYSTFSACLDACARYNENQVPGGKCLGATWVIFSPTKPQDNSKCFLKNSTQATVTPTNGTQLASGFLETSS
ncbi:hypothetical protein B0O99DRAFT_356559 [Bisporella sp. PMI_857]|nr:hypothetical protein B0O99DRAFT_356559 [Bisporella sp. PMI_857]